jgi:xanthine dehydrogenase small subunit
MLRFILNNDEILTELPSGTTVLDFVRYHKNLKGTKIGCREGDCGACTILVGELRGDDVRYRSMTSCLMPLANAAGKHIVTVEGINPEDGSLTPVQEAMVEASGTQCGFCTVGFVMSLTGFCLENTKRIPEAAVSSIDGNICRCTGYKSIERAAEAICRQLDRSEPPASSGGREPELESELSVSTISPPADAGGSELCGNASLRSAIGKLIVPRYFSDIAARVKSLDSSAPLPPEGGTQNAFVGGGTDVYVQRPEQMVEAAANALFYDDSLRFIRDAGQFMEIGASVTVTDLLESPVMQAIFPNLYKHLKLVSSTPIRNMATLAGNFVNASPIGDMTAWFLALDASIELVRSEPPASAGSGARGIRLRDFYRGYKQLDKADDEYITTIRFRKPVGDFRFNFEKVSKRTYLDIATVNTAISLTVESIPGEAWVPPALAEVSESNPLAPAVEYTIVEAHVSAGGVAPVPLYLEETSAYLRGKQVAQGTISDAAAIIQSEISPISDVRGTADYKRLLLRQLFTAHFDQLFVSNVDAGNK